jgi:hypothetical protein
VVVGVIVVVAVEVRVDVTVALFVGVLVDDTVGVGVLDNDIVGVFVGVAVALVTARRGAAPTVAEELAPKK